MWKDLLVLYFIIAFLIWRFCDDGGFDAAAKGILWPIFVLLHGIRLIAKLIGLEVFEED